MRGGANSRQASPERPGDLESYQRLIELQKEIIELVERNAKAEHECVQLRKQLARETDELFRSTQSLRFRLRRIVAKLFKRTRSPIRREFIEPRRPNLRLLQYPTHHAQNH